MKSTRAFVDPVTLALIAGLAAGIFFGSWKPLAMFRKPPDTAALTALQAQLTAQQAVAAQAAKDAEAAKVAERAKLEAQIRAAQADNLGAQTALKKVPSAYRTPEVNLADRMTQRVSLKLTSAIGALPHEQQEAMIELIDQALSDKQAEVDEANRKLAKMDTDFKAVTSEREQLKAEIPKLVERAQKAEATAQETAAEVTVKTNEVKAKADALYKATQENGSLWNSMKRTVYLVVGGYVFLAFILPGLVKHLDPTNPFKGLLRGAAGYLTSPMMFHDASKKIEALKGKVKP